MKSNNGQAKMSDNLNQTKVLFIEDNDDHWLLMRKIIEPYLPHTTLMRVASSERALALLNEYQYQEWELPKLILLDLHLPDEQDGWELLKQIKAMAFPLNKIPIVMYSSSAEPTDIEKAYALGISAYMVKPTNFNEWSSQLQALCLYWGKTAALLPTYYVFDLLP